MFRDLDLFDVSHYFFNPYAVPSLLTTLAVLTLCALLLIVERFSRVAVTLAALGIVVTIWLTSNFFVYSATEEALSVWWAKASYLGIPFIPAGTYHFAVSVLKIGGKYRKFVWAAWIISALFAVVSITTDSIVGGVISYPWGYSPKIAPLNLVLILYMLTIHGLSLRHLWIGQKEAAPNSVQSKRIKAFLTAFAIGSFGLVDYIAGAGVPVYPFGFVGIFSGLCILAVTVRKYRLVDITPRFAAQSILDTMNDALLVLDGEGVIRLVNNATTRVLGHPEPRLVGRHVTTIFEPGSAPVLLTDQPGRNSIQHLELPYEHPDGSKRVISLSVSLMKDARRSPLAHVYIARDITGIRQTEAELIRARDELELRVEERSADLRRANERMIKEINERKKVEEELSRVFNLVPDMIAVVSSEGHLKKVNSAWEKTLGFTQEELLSRSVIDFIHPDDIAPTMEEVRNQINGKITINFINRYRCKDGTYKWLEWAAAASHDRSLLFSAARDITERKKTEEELRRTQKLESLGVLAGGIAHDFNNILTAILGSISLVRIQLEHDDKLYKQLEEAEKASVHAKDLTQQLLTFSKGGAPIKKAIRVEQVIQDATRFALRGTNVRSEFLFASGLWPVEADKGQLGQVFNNLVINSCQAMPGGGTVEIGAENATVEEENGLFLPGGRYVSKKQLKIDHL